MRIFLTSAMLGLLFASAALCAEAPTSTPAATVDVAAARVLFATYEAAEDTFDPAVADLYCDTALIVNKRTLADGSLRELTMAAPNYKALIRQAMPLARSRGDRNEYRDVVFVEVAGGVRITATRHSLLKDSDSPLSLLVGDCAGTPAIVEELSSSTE